jgi:DNA-binding XRE family transcriptional regulator
MHRYFPKMLHHCFPKTIHRYFPILEHCYFLVTPNQVPLRKDSSPYKAQLNVLGIYFKQGSMNNNIPDENQKVLNEISTFLREYRLQSGYTQGELCEFTNLHRNTIVRAESGKNISLLTLIELSSSMGLSLRDLFV